MNFGSGDIASQTWTHFYLSVLGTVAGGVIGLLLAIVCRKRPKLATFFMGIAEVIQTFPSIALLAILLLVFGLGNTTLVVALGLYGIMPVLQNTYEGLTSVDSVYLDIAKGMGMKPSQIFWRVELPMSIPVILAGFRVSLVTSIGIATIGVFVGAGGLGVLIFRGLQILDNQLLLEGAIPAALLAIVVELVMVYLEKRMSQKYGK
ncbi:ABC transporter permease [Fodinisporobacter ferrooxydans]|uniref:ABC transporter permease n=1 Tax=Fodinisporobacter ferrooxydans TaxID=2901836 RepID=A0ABY4CHA9_9BACL|nr:ABC transporter permease [Alicyclobacillaceae bacterium MYW30-H2]